MINNGLVLWSQFQTVYMTLQPQYLLHHDHDPRPKHEKCIAIVLIPKCLHGKIIGLMIAVQLDHNDLVPCKQSKWQVTYLSRR